MPWKAIEPLDQNAVADPWITCGNGGELFSRPRLLVL